MESARLTRTFDAGAAKMWSLWTDPDHLSMWFRPSLDGFGPSTATFDARPGGAYRIEMISADGSVLAVSGQVVEADEPNRLCYTWRWDGDENESLVEVTFAEEAGRTTVTIEHTRLADPDAVARHAQGWRGCLESLARTI